MGVSLLQGLGSSVGRVYSREVSQEHSPLAGVVRDISTEGGGKTSLQISLEGVV